MGCFPNRFLRRWQFLTSVISMPRSNGVVRDLQCGLVWLFSHEQHAVAVSALCRSCKQWLMSFISADTFSTLQHCSVSQVAEREVVLAAISPSIFFFRPVLFLSYKTLLKPVALSILRDCLAKCLKEGLTVKLCGENGESKNVSSLFWVSASVCCCSVFFIYLFFKSHTDQQIYLLPPTWLQVSAVSGVLTLLLFWPALFRGCCSQSSAASISYQLEKYTSDRADLSFIWVHISGCKQFVYLIVRLTSQKCCLYR